MHVVHGISHPYSTPNENWRAAIWTAATGKESGFHGHPDVDRQLWVESLSCAGKSSVSGKRDNCGGGLLTFVDNRSKVCHLRNMSLIQLLSITHHRRYLLAEAL